MIDRTIRQTPQTMTRLNLTSILMLVLVTIGGTGLVSKNDNTVFAATTAPSEELAFPKNPNYWTDGSAVAMDSTGIIQLLSLANQALMGSGHIVDNTRALKGVDNIVVSVQEASSTFSPCLGNDFVSAITQHLRSRLSAVKIDATGDRIKTRDGVLMNLTVTPLEASGTYVIVWQMHVCKPIPHDLSPTHRVAIDMYIYETSGIQICSKANLDGNKCAVVNELVNRFLVVWRVANGTQ